MYHECEKDILRINVGDELLLKFSNGRDGYSGKLTDDDLLKFSQWLGDELQRDFVKPDFRKFSYISIEPSRTATIIVYSIVVFINLLTGVFVVLNPWSDEANYQSRNFRRNFRRRF